MNSRLEWNRLRVLDAVARTGSIAKGAQALGMTGPAVSQQIRRLESECRVKIVEPAGRGIRLTSDGAVLARYAERIAALVQEADNAIHQSAPLAGVVRLGGVASALRTLVAAELAHLKTAHPAVSVHLEDGEAVDHIKQLADGHLDLVVAESWSPNPVRLQPGLRCQRIRVEPAFIAVRTDHPHAGDDEADFRKFTPDAWATCAAGSDAHVALTQIANAHGVDLNVQFHVADHLTQIELVRAGLAVACVPASARQHVDSTVTLVPLPASLHRELLLISNRANSSRTTAYLANRLVNQASLE